MFWALKTGRVGSSKLMLLVDRERFCLLQHMRLMGQSEVFAQVTGHVAGRDGGPWLLTALRLEKSTSNRRSVWTQDSEAAFMGTNTLELLNLSSPCRIGPHDFRNGVFSYDLEEQRLNDPEELYDSILVPLWINSEVFGNVFSVNSESGFCKLRQKTIVEWNEMIKIVEHF